MLPLFILFCWTGICCPLYVLHLAVKAGESFTFLHNVFNPVKKCPFPDLLFLFLRILQMLTTTTLLFLSGFKIIDIY